MRNKYLWLVLLFVAYLSNACTDTQDEHYDRFGSLPDKTLSELIAADANLSVFSGLIKITGYDTWLSSSQTFTVWAPDNSALADVDVNTITQEEAKMIVENHIARYNYSTSTDPTKAIRMRNNKVYSFSDAGSLFGGAVIQEHDILAKNGILHTLQSEILYFPNIYEYILTSPQTTKMAEFIRQFDEYIIDTQFAEPDGSIRDTVYIRYNPLFDENILNWDRTAFRSGLGQINTEDSLYTALIPDDTAWEAAYERISPYFKSVRNNDSIQRVQTSLAIVEDLFFRGVIDNPAGENLLVTTSPSMIGQPAVLFEGTQKIQASNGLVFLVGNHLNYDAQETFMKPIFVEADEQEGRRITGNTTIVPRVLEGNSEIQATDSRFLEVYQTSLDDNLNNQPVVTFDIPQVLSGRYNLYAEFLPGELAIQGDKLATKFRVTLSYRNANGNTATSLVNNIETSATEKVKVLLFSNFAFPVANYYDRLWFIDFTNGLYTIEQREVSTKLDIAVRVTATEYNSRTFGRSFCLDRIILEPVQN